MKTKRKGFTLIELLVATAVFSLMIVFLFSIINDATKIWQRQHAQEENFRESRAALDIITRDIEGALTTGPSNWFYSSNNRVAFLTSLSSIAQSKDYNRGDICAVGYSLEWGKLNSGNPSEKERMSLYRYVRFSDPTYSKNILNSEGVEGIFTNPDGVTTVRELLTPNVPAISFSFYSTTPTGEPTPYTGAEPMPKIFDIILTVLNDKTAIRLDSKAAWENTDSPIILQNAQTFYLHVRP